MVNTRIIGLAPLLLAACATGLTNAPSAVSRDCELCPVMVEIPGGKFLMGTAEADRLIDPRTGKPAKNDLPQHAVSVQPFALGRYEVTVAQYRAFVTATGHTSGGKCMAISQLAGGSDAKEVSWQDPGFDQPDDAGVSCVSFFDAQAYAEWLSRETGRDYRLPTEAEWEYAARAGSTTPYHWGRDAARACDYANIRSPGASAISQRQADSDEQDGFPCDDGAANASSVGSYQPNAFGLHDMQGNQWEWVADCNHKDYNGAPTDGSAWLDDKPCQFGMIRGGSYLNRVERSSTAVRVGRPRSGKGTNMGFRVARGGAPSNAATTIVTAPTKATVNDDSEAAQLFLENCAACHIESDNFQGLYGTDQVSLVTTISNGGNNVMSMPAFDDRLTAEEIAALARYLRRVNGWD